MNQFLFGLLLFLSVTSIPAFGDVKRTDGPPGSEYGDPNTLEGELQIGLHFGALLKQGVSSDSSFSLGADIDWRPFDLFGFRLQALQGLQTPRSTIISLLPLAHTEISNLRPYVVAGPGIAIVDANGDNEVKFAVNAGLGADIMLMERFGIGMQYLYSSVMDFKDLHFLGARIIIAFPPSW